MTHARPDDEAMLRSVLHAAADQVEPRADGLERIQRRLARPRPVAVAWAMITWTRLSMRVSTGLQFFVDRAVTEYRLATERFMPPPANRNGRTRLVWLRPVSAMAVSVAIIGAVIYMAAGFSQVASPSSSDSGSLHSGRHNGASNQQGGPGRSQAQSGFPQTGRSGRSSGSPNGSNCSTGTSTPTSPPSTILPPSSSAPTISSPTPSHSPSPTPTLTTPPTPTPTPTSTSSNPGSGTSSSPTVGSNATHAKPTDGSKKATVSGQDSAARTLALEEPASAAIVQPTVSASCSTPKKTSRTTPDAAGPAVPPAVTAESAKGKIG
jgi:hypothetical protein